VNDRTKKQAEPNAPSRVSVLVQSWMRFWFSPSDNTGLCWLRGLTGLLLLALLAPFAGDPEAFLGLTGWVDYRAYAELARVPNARQQISWSLLYLCGQNRQLLEMAYWLSICLLTAYTLGIWPRITSLCAWLIAVSFTSNPASVSGADRLLVLLTFYVMAAHWLERFFPYGVPLASSMTGGVRLGRESVGANIGLRLLQVHFAMIVFAGGLRRLQHGEWWSGVALWYPLHPPFPGGREVNSESMRLYLFGLSALAYAAIAWQIGFPFFAWRRRWRPLLLLGAAASWVGATFIYHAPPEGPAFAVACLSFLTPDEWRRLDWLIPRHGMARSQVEGKKKRPGQGSGLMARTS
jgi:hypothetical protein